MELWQFWLIAAGVFLIAEIFTSGFLIFWLGIAALLAMLVSFFTTNIIIQTAVFVITSALLIFLTKPFITKYVTKKDKSVATNAFSLIGKTGVVTKTIPTSPGSLGQVKVGEEIWSAITTDSSEIPEGTEVIIKKIDGVKLVVSTINKNQKN